MMMAYARFLIAAICLALPFGTTARADEVSTLRDVATVLLADGESADLLAACPADYAGFPKLADGPGCEGRAKACLRECILEDATACLHLGYALQSGEVYGVPGQATQAAFARACAFGRPAGCTNRAAGMMTMPAPESPQDERDSCTFKSFRSSCEAGDAWGCSMLTLHYAEGIGTPVDGDAVKATAHKTCGIWPDSEACDAAAAIFKRLTQND